MNNQIYSLSGTTKSFLLLLLNRPCSGFPVSSLNGFGLVGFHLVGGKCRKLRLAAMYIPGVIFSSCESSSCKVPFRHHASYPLTYSLTSGVYCGALHCIFSSPACLINTLDPPQPLLSKVGPCPSLPRYSSNTTVVLATLQNNLSTEEFGHIGYLKR